MLMAAVFVFLVLSDFIYTKEEALFKARYEVAIADDIYKAWECEEKEGKTMDEARSLEGITFFFELINPSEDCQIFFEVDNEKFHFDDLFLFEKLLVIDCEFDDPKFYKDQGNNIKYYFQYIGSPINESQYGLQFNYPKGKIPKRICMSWIIFKDDLEKMMNYHYGPSAPQFRKFFTKENKEVKVAYAAEGIKLKVKAYNKGKEMGQVILPLQDIQFRFWHKKEGLAPELKVE